MLKEFILIILLLALVNRILDQINRRSCGVSTLFSLSLCSCFSHEFFKPIGQQLTNAEGVAVFETVYPGWYTGRATHVHVKVHVGATVTNIGGALMTRGGHVSYIGQLYFNDSLSDEVAKLSPYAKHTIRRTRNREDFIYSEGKGSTTLVPIQFLTAAGLRGGVQGEITLGINPKAVSTNTWNPEWELQTPPGR